ncbi:energy transducer TonB [Flavobacterium hungaricum]|uniref:Energy transducer TonB n=1 Tax=Flavobacterium hungaricum TaxID=2082725 RepID=A0ABR9TKF4_9FLAO|nr:energy transducer TonB [Flavobacterium hungaricum]MBE8725304.1 energy transducer TonB [Flavobacterium hungaricum]
MKKILFLFILTFISLSISAQKDLSRAVYLDSLYRETSEQEHKYIRVIEDYHVEKEAYKVVLFYKSGTKKMIGTTLNKDVLINDGTFIYFYENGVKEAVITYSEGWKTGKEYKWYDNGNPKFEKENTSDPKAKTSKTLLSKFWNKENQLTVIDGNGECDNADEDFQEKGTIKNGLKEGIWQGSDLKNKITFTENYSHGNLISGISTDKNDVKYSYSKLSEKPTPATGIDQFYKNIGLNYKTPEQAFINKVTGKIYITFIVDETGKITKPIIIKDLGYGTGEEALRVLSTAANWIPGKFRGIKRSALYSLPITITSR